MGKPAARIGDMHVCPMVTPGVPPIPHVGGAIVGPGAPTVMIGSMPAAVMGDMAICVGPPSTIILGSMGVMIGGKPAARMGDMTAHGGSIVLGLPTVMIGEMCPGGGGGGGASVEGVGASAAPAVKMAINNVIKKLGANAMAAAMNAMSLANGASSGDAEVERIEKNDVTTQYTLVDEAEKGVEGVDYEIETPDGQKHKGKTDGSGKTITLSGFSVSECNVTYFKN